MLKKTLIIQTMPIRYWVVHVIQVKYNSFDT